MLLKNKLLPFFGKAVIYFIVITLVWYYVIGPVYNDVLAATADGLTRGYTIWHSADTIYVIKHGSDEQNGIFAMQLQYGLILVLALIAATPGIRITRRLAYMPITLVTIFVIHVISILVFTWATRYESPGSNPIVILFTIFGSSLFPVVVWGAFSFKYLLPRPQDAGKQKPTYRLRGKRRLKAKN